MEEKDLETFKLINDGDFNYITGDIGLDPYNIINSDDSLGNSEMDPIILNALNSENSALQMEDFKYISADGFLKNCYPPEEPSELSNTDYSGPYSFEVFVDPNGLKSPWEYSSIFNKIYIDINQKFPINFSTKTRPESGLLFIRVTPVYEEDKYARELVHRCICHEQQHDPSNSGVERHVTQHIIRCDNNATHYFGNKDLPMPKRLNLLMPLSNPVTGTDSVKELFYFVCMTSCSGGGGMNRRPIQIIFTLENEFGTVVGRRVLRVRVCACPKRDKEKEEKKKEKFLACTKGKKRKLEKKTPPPATEVTDNSVISTTINVVGEKNQKLLLKFARSLMSDEVVKLQTAGANAAAEVPFKKCINEINGLLNPE